MSNEVRKKKQKKKTKEQTEILLQLVDGHILKSSREIQNQFLQQTWEEWCTPIYYDGQ